MKNRLSLLCIGVSILGVLASGKVQAVSILSSLDDSRTTIVSFASSLGYDSFGHYTSVLLDPNKTYNIPNQEGGTTPGTIFDMDVVVITQFPNVPVLQSGVAPGGTLEQYVSDGGVLVIIAATTGSPTDIAPGGVDVLSVTSLSDEISSPQHPYITGEGYGGYLLSDNDFDGWLPTDLGTLTNLAPNSEIIVSNSVGPTLVEYPWGDGIVILTTMTYGFDCTTFCNEPVREAPLENLLNYAVFSTLSGPIDSDGDGLTDTQEAELGTDPDDPDTDNDGLLDGTEVEMADGSNCPDPLNPDSDGDNLLDGVEVIMETNPCNPDSDGDGLDDSIDPLPNEPGATTGYIEDESRATAQEIGTLVLDVFSGPNNNANKGRRNSLANRATEAANQVATGDIAGAIDSLTSLLEKVDGQPSPKDWMADSPEKTELAEQVSFLIELLNYEL